jgi:acyl transferase domain-containing protein
MKSAGAQLGERLSTMEIRVPRIRYLSAVDAREHQEADDIRQLLVRQLSSPVRWTSTVAALGAAGARQIIECGPGGVLAGLVKRITRGGDILRSRNSWLPRPSGAAARRAVQRKLHMLQNEIALVTGASRELARPSPALAGAGARAVGTATSETGAQGDQFVA